MNVLFLYFRHKCMLIEVVKSFEFMWLYVIPADNSKNICGGMRVNLFIYKITSSIKSLISFKLTQLLHGKPRYQIYCKIFKNAYFHSKNLKTTQFSKTSLTPNHFLRNLASNFFNQITIWCSFLLSNSRNGVDLMLPLCSRESCGCHHVASMPFSLWHPKQQFEVPQL